MKRKTNAAQLIFIIYFLILMWIVLFKTTFAFSEIQWFGGERTVNLIPFHYGNDVGKFHVREVLANVLVFVPMGIYLKMFDLPVLSSVLIGCGVSFMFEFCQFALVIGASDITDLITNTFGTFAGVCLYLTALKIFRGKNRTNRIINVSAAVVILCFCALAALLIIAN